MSDNKKQVGFEVDSEAWERAKEKAEWGEMTERLRRAVHEKAYGTEVTERKRLRDKRDALRSDVREIENTIKDEQHKRDEKQRELERVEQRLETLEQQDGEYDGFIQALEGDLRDGKRIFVNHGKVERAAELGECDPSDVVEALQERNPEVPESAFREPRAGEQPNWKDAVDNNTTTTQT